MFQGDGVFEKVIIIGNGFDLNLGLKTSYLDFINSNEFNQLILDGNRIGTELLTKQKFQKWIDVENELGQISLRYDSDDIEDEFEELKNALCKFIANIDYNKISNYSNAYNFLMSHISNSFIILDFNYTESVKKILLEAGKTESEINQVWKKVHGSALKNDIIFGVEDSARTSPKDVYMKKSSNLHIEPLDLDRLMKPISELHIFGHSLGQTDHSYFKTFFESRTNNSYSNAAKICIHYFGRTGKNQIMHQLDTLTYNRMIKLRQGNNFEMFDSSAPAT